MVQQASRQRALILNLLSQHGTMRSSRLKSDGVHAVALSRLVSGGDVVRTSRGVYQIAGHQPGPPHGLADMAVRFPGGIVCLVSALQFHGITLQNPREFWLAIANSARKPAVNQPPVRIVRFSAAALAAGVDEHLIDGVPVKIFGPAKTVVDCFRFRRTVGLDVCLEALRLTLESRKATPAEIASLAKRLRIWSVMRPYLESAADAA